MSDEQQAPELKPCYCRSSASGLSVRPNMDHGDFGCKERGYRVFCGNCWASGPTASTEEKARQYWNKFRSDLSPVAQPPLRSHPRVNLLLVALRKVRDNAPTLEAAKAIATIAIEEYVESGKDSELKR